MNRTNIPYLDFTWNPLAMRCRPVSAGCKNCWHIKMADRCAANPIFDTRVRAAYSGNRPRILVESRLEEPLRRKKPAVIGVQFMGDLFFGHPKKTRNRNRIFDVMERAKQHKFLVLTKRVDQLICYFEYAYEGGIATGWGDSRIPPHIWLGESVENQETADERTAELLKIPAAVHVVSVEPMLEKIDLDMMGRNYGRDFEHWSQHVDWVICGDESGSNRRPVDLDAVRDLRDQCIQADVPFFLKQLHIDGKRVEMPELDGRIWNEMPEGMVWCPVCEEIGEQDTRDPYVSVDMARTCDDCKIGHIKEIP